MNWKIDSLLVKPQEDGKADVVVTANWSCSETDQGQTATVAGNMGFLTIGDPFVPYPALTEAQVLDWCYANGVNKDQTEALVAQQLADLINPPVVSKPLPWSA